MADLRQRGTLFSSFTLILAVVISGAMGSAFAQPDPREIPVPPIKTGEPELPGVDALPDRPELPDPLQRADGSRVADAADWPSRRAEIRRVLDYYAAGRTPPPPGNVVGHELKSELLLDGTVRYRLIRLTFGPSPSLGFDIATFQSAKATGPQPTIIFLSFDPTPGAALLPLLPRPPGQGKGVNALLPVEPNAAPSPARLADPAKSDPEKVAAKHRALLERGYALVAYNYQDTGEDTTLRQPDGSWAFRTTRYYPAYPRSDWGLLAGWAWGTSRVVDYLETQAFADKTKLILTGHSRLGKAVLVAGAFDERFSLVAPVGTGGGGTGVYRFSGEGRGGKEGLDEMMRKYPNWFSPHLHQFRGRPDRLPFDQHWFIALVAPRPFIALEGTDDPVSLANAVEQSFRGARPVYELLGVPQKLGVHYAKHGHEFAAEDWAALLDFADQQLSGKTVSRRFDQFAPTGK